MTASNEALAIELMIDRATEGLDPAGESRLSSLLEELPELDDEDFEIAAAAIDLAYTLPTQPLPAALREKISVQAREHFAKANGEPSTGAVVTPFPAPEATPEPSGSGSWIGWLAAAACLALAVMSWLPRPAPPPGIARAELIDGASDLLRVEWSATDPESPAGGDVVWSNSDQCGFMLFRDLPINDPSVEQYQLWIFDANQDERYPIDGGVFDVIVAGEVVVPIDPKLPVREPTLFAITIEKPGGVVVSSRERLPLLAKVG